MQDTGSRGPSWWSPDFPDLLARREPMPGVERWQTTYVRYRRFAEAQVAQAGWDLATSRRSYEQLVRAEQQHFLPEDHLLFSALAPESINVKIVESPAEFAVPVKQDRRLAPSFRLRVEVKYRQALSFPLTLKAHVVSQQEKDNILNWHPEEVSDQDKAAKAVTDLKGTMCITHHFESAPMHNGGSFGSGNGRQSSSTPFPYNMMQQQQQQQQQRGGMGLGNDREHRLMAAETAANLGLYPGGLSSGRNSINSNTLDSILMDYPQLQTHSPLGGQPHAQLLDAGNQGVNTNLLLNLFNEPNDSKLMEQVLLQQQAANGGLNMNGLFPFNSSGLDLGNGLPEAAMLLNQRQQQLQQQQQHRYHHQPSNQSGPVHQPRLSHGAPTMFNDSSANSNGVNNNNGEMHTIVQDFEFANLEFLKPTRMNKVYMVFAANILDLDTLFIVYNIPTIGICRAEQREKACQKLGVNYSSLSHFEPPMQNNIKPEQDFVPAAGVVGVRKRDDSESSEGNFQPLKAGDLTFANPRISNPGDDILMAHPRSRMAMREWIHEEYEGTGLTRKLTQLDMQALLSQAGFPMDASSEHASISQVQWDEFSLQFSRVLSLLRQIAGVWNLEDPCVISGFDMDRQGTVQALVSEPSGTFICRFSMSQPGCLVLTCKVGPIHPKADAEGLIHAIIKIDDLYERRVDTWIRDFAGATHVLDVYRQKRVDKRKVFASNYMRLRGLESEPPLDIGSPYA